ncbi:MAG: peptidase M28 [Cytophagaceae bacterium SCN 52-12]|nr:MAG: peptidase M28 [Cytophagaceae bacterium SCN 52-12]
MFKRLPFLSGALVLLTLQAGAQSTAGDYAGTITPENLRKHLTVIAHDSLEGRATGSPGQKKAAEYVASYYRQYGLKPAAADASGKPGFFQVYNLYRGAWESAHIRKGRQLYELNRDFYIDGLANMPEDESLTTIFAGYGISEGSYNDYENLDVRNKAVVVFEGEPGSGNGNYLLSGSTEPSKWGRARAWEEKARLALSKGARTIIIISSQNAQGFEKEIQRRASMAPRVRRLSLRQEEAPARNLAAFTVGEAAAASLLGIREKKLKKLKAKTDKGSSSWKKHIGDDITIMAKRQSEVVPTENVAALLEGTDKKDEIVVISAHLDHIGISPDGQINNGADDDGTGTVALLELAEAFSKAKAEGKGPRRSILFLNVTGEEMGLLGSEFYSENPLFPSENHVANLNIDMIGRVDDAHKDNPDYVYLIGSDKLSSELHAISENANQKYVNLTLDYTFNHPDDPNRFYYRSDHYNFAKKGIPVIFYFTGVHEDYHRPGDDVEKILFDRQARIVKLIFHTAWELANRGERIKVDSNKP